MAAGCGQASAQTMEVRAAVGAQADELAVEQQLATVEGVGEPSQLGELVSAVAARA